MTYAHALIVVLAHVACSPSFRECAPPSSTELARIPRTLRATGLYSEAGTLADGVVAFAPRYELWSDGAVKQRWLYLPPGAQIDTRDPEHWRFPAGATLWKQFTRNGIRVETRWMLKHGDADDAWTMAAYVWRGDDAHVVVDGASDAAGTAHDVPSVAQCGACHDDDGPRVLGLSAIQLPATGRDAHVGVAELAAGGRFTTEVRATELPGDEGVQHALGYLHANCGHCHDGARPPRSPRCFDPQRSFDLSLRTDSLTEPSTTPAYRTAIGELVTPGDPEGSALLTRVRSRDRWWGMPALGTEVVDEAGVALLARWIRGL